MMDDQILMSRFELKLGKCKTKADLTNLCKTYLDHIGEPVVADNPLVQTSLPDIKTVYVGPDSQHFKKYHLQKSISDYEMMNFSAAEMLYKKSVIEQELTKSLVKEMIQDQSIKFDTVRDLRLDRRIFHARVGVVKL